MAQIITAMQMVYEEKFVNSKDINPLQAVGWEGNLCCIKSSFMSLVSLQDFQTITVCLTYG